MIMESLTSRHFLEIFIRICLTIDDQEIYLSELDGVIGDGDHGISMVKAFRAVKREMRAWENLEIHEILDNAGITVMNSAGGTTGPLFGTFFLKLSNVAKGKKEIQLVDFVQMLKDAEIGIRELGNANEGDKSLLDTLAPANRALERAYQEGRGFPDAIKIMETAAYNGWLSTKDMVSKIGRSHRLGERTIGHLDAGATSMYFILREMASVFDVSNE